MHTAKLLGLSLDEFWDMNLVVFNRMCGLYLEMHGKANPYDVGYIDD